MTWFRVDDNLPHHHKVLAAGNAAMGLWVRAGALCAQQLTDGNVSAAMLHSLGTDVQAARLVAAGLWDETDDGYRFHDWLGRNPAKTDVEAERKAARDRQRRWRDRNAVTNGVSNASTRSAPDRPRDRAGSPAASPQRRAGDARAPKNSDQNAATTPKNGARHGVTNAAPARAFSRPDPTLSSQVPSSHDAPPPPLGLAADAAETRRDLSNNQRAAQRALRCPPDDPRLDAIDDLVKIHTPRNPRAWLATVITNGDFDDLLADAATPPEDPWAHLPMDTGMDTGGDQ